MFKNAKAIIKRPHEEKIENEIVFGTPTTIYSNIPCHLSVKSLNAVNQSQSTASVLYTFTLFTDAKYVIEPNDIIEVTTATNEVHKLRAGQTKRYILSAQTNCEALDVV